MNGINFDKILEVITDFLGFIGEMLLSAVYGLAMIFSYIYSVIAESLTKINIPILPSRTKILQQNLISGGFLSIFVIYIILINIVSFNAFRIDKKKAKKSPPKNENPNGCRKYDRISERRLLSLCFFGGAFGGFLAMHIFRHKTLKPKFSVGVLIMLILQLLLFSFICGFFGFWLYLS